MGTYSESVRRVDMFKKKDYEKWTCLRKKIFQKKKNFFFRLRILPIVPVQPNVLQPNQGYI